MRSAKVEGVEKSQCEDVQARRERNVRVLEEM